LNNKEYFPYKSNSLQKSYQREAQLFCFFRMKLLKYFKSLHEKSFNQKAKTAEEGLSKLLESFLKTS